MKESAIQAAIRVALGKLPDICLWRNSVARVQTPDGAWVHCGLPKGSADLIGILLPAGRFFALECKSEKGRLSPEQTAWLAVVRKFGGFAGVARNVPEALAAVERARRGEHE